MSRFAETSPTLSITRSQRDHQFGWGRPLAAALTGVLTLTAGLVGVSAATAGAAVGATPAGPPSASAGIGGDCTQPSTVKVRATGIPILDKRNVQEAIATAEGRRNGCALLIGHFNLGFCVFCLRVTRPVTVSGQADPTGSSPNRKGVTVMSTTGGAGSLAVNEPPDVPAGVVQIRDIWWNLSYRYGPTVLNSYRGTVEFIQNRITNLRDPGPIRGAIGAGNGVPGTEVLEGSLVVQDNYINLTALPGQPLNDNGIGLAGVHFTSIDISHNTIITKGDSIEIEGSVGTSYNLSDNTLVTKYAEVSPLTKPVVTVGYPRLHGGDPNTIKLAGNDVAITTVLDNDVTAGGGSPTTVCIMDFQVAPSRFHPIRLTEIARNRCTMSGIFAGLLGGWAGTLPVWGPGTLDDAVVTDNIFTGTAAFGIAMLDFKVPLLPVNNLVNTSHGDVFRDNNFSTFTASKAALYLGPSTHNNLFVGSLRGTIVNLGRDNVIIMHSTGRGDDRPVRTAPPVAVVR